MSTNLFTLNDSMKVSISSIQISQRLSICFLQFDERRNSLFWIKLVGSSEVSCIKYAGHALP